MLWRLTRGYRLCPWKSPYLRWRNELKAFHARKTGEILREVGYSEEIITRVQALNLKKNFPTDPDSRVLEDALCLVFLQYQLADLARKTADEKVIKALQKSWKKMTPQAQAYALQLAYSPEERSLIERALRR